LKDVQLALLREIGDRISEYGFSSRPSGQSFLRKFDGGRASFHVGFVVHTDKLYVVGDVAIRFDFVENVVNEGALHLSAKEKGKTYTLGSELGRIAAEGQRSWGVNRVEEAASVAEDVVGFFEKHGLPYIERNSSMEAAYQALMSPAPVASLYNPLLLSRCYRIVALAVALGKNTEVNQRAFECIEKLMDANNPLVQEFKDFSEGVGRFL
jgi:hypothetical protein